MLALSSLLLLDYFIIDNEITISCVDATLEGSYEFLHEWFPALGYW